MCIAPVMPGCSSGSPWAWLFEKVLHLYSVTFSCQLPLTAKLVSCLAKLSGLHRHPTCSIKSMPCAIHMPCVCDADRELLKVQPGAAAVVTNGRVVLSEANALATGQPLTAADLKLMDMYAASNQFSTEVRPRACMVTCLSLYRLYVRLTADLGCVKPISVMAWIQKWLDTQSQTSWASSVHVMRWLRAGSDGVHMKKWGCTYLALTLPSSAQMHKILLHSTAKAYPLEAVQRSGGNALLWWWS